MQAKISISQGQEQKTLCHPRSHPYQKPTVEGSQWGLPNTRLPQPTLCWLQKAAQQGEATNPIPLKQAQNRNGVQRDLMINRFQPPTQKKTGG